uniref:Uncharacterized protein n=1 Tax=Romanomermis culicivorax TaxID=13658 RepID=A0A915HXB3_ROMCU
MYETRHVEQREPVVRNASFVPRLRSSVCFHADLVVLIAIVHPTTISVNDAKLKVKPKFLFYKQKIQHLKQTLSHMVFVSNYR